MRLELFQLGKFKSDEIWKPNQSQENYPHATITKTQTPRRPVQSLNYAARNIQYGGSTKQPSYHVPPCKKTLKMSINTIITDLIPEKQLRIFLIHYLN